MTNERVPGYQRNASVVDRDGTAVNLAEHQLRSIGFGETVTQYSEPNAFGVDQQRNNKRNNCEGSFDVCADADTRAFMRGGDIQVNDYREQGDGTGKPNWSFSARIPTRTLTIAGEEIVRIACDVSATSAVAKTTQ